MKILLSAYACEPGRGSEPEVGFRAMLAAATRHEVWVLTRSNNIPALRDSLREHDLRDRIHLEGLDVPGLPMRLKHRGVLGLHWYYDRWQKLAGRHALSLDGRVGFDLVHHVTFASYWNRAGVISVAKPFLWGPVGGGVTPLLTLLPELGVQGAVEDVGRIVLRKVSELRPVVRAQQGRAVLALVQNRDTGRRLSGAIAVEVLPNAMSARLNRPPRVSLRDFTVVFAGRLAPWKGAMIAARTFRYVRHPSAKLAIFGKGPDRKRVQKAIHAWGIADRVAFMGQVPRAELMSAVASCAVLLHTSIHEESGFSVAEALLQETPVVGLDHGGPRELVRLFPRAPSTLVPPTTPTGTARRLAAAVDSYLARPMASLARSSEEVNYFDQRLLAAYEEIVAR